jgi:uncharacterized membrane protein
MSAAKRRSGSFDLLTVVLVGGLTTLALYATPHFAALRAVLGLPFLLLGPGYALTSALFAHEQSETSVRLVLTLALSIAAMVLVGVALDAAGIALTARALDLALLAVATAACGVAAVRRRSAPTTESREPARALRSPWLWSTAALVAVFAVLVAVLARPLPDKTFAAYTQLSALRSGAGGVSVAVKSAEHRFTTYELDVRAASGLVIRRTFVLAPGQQWTSVIHTGAPQAQTVDIRLYRAVAPTTVYRALTLRA